MFESFWGFITLLVLAGWAVVAIWVFIVVIIHAIEVVRGRLNR